MKSAFDKIAAGIEDAIAFAEGRDSKAKIIKLRLTRLRAESNHPPSQGCVE